MACANANYVGVCGNRKSGGGRVSTVDAVPLRAATTNRHLLLAVRHG